MIAEVCRKHHHALADSHGGQGVIGAAQVEDGEADQNRYQRRDGAGHHQADQRGDVEVVYKDRGHIRADGHIDAVSQRQQSGEAAQHVPGGGHIRPEKTHNGNMDVIGLTQQEGQGAKNSQTDGDQSPLFDLLALCQF